MPIKGKGSVWGIAEFTSPINHNPYYLRAYRLAGEDQGTPETSMGSAIRQKKDSLRARKKREGTSNSGSRVKPRRQEGRQEKQITLLGWSEGGHRQSGWDGAGGLGNLLRGVAWVWGETRPCEKMWRDSEIGSESSPMASKYL